jgi:hypothetical protein
MKKFIIKTLLLLLPVIILAIPVEYLLRDIPNVYSFKKQYLDGHSNELEILILGSSHTYYGINPVHFSKNTFNAGCSSQSLDFDLAILNKYQNNLNNLKIIILPVSCFSLFSNLEDRLVKNYALYYEMSTNSLSINSELLSFNLTINLMRLYRYYIRKDGNINCTKLGWGAEYHSKNAKDLQETGKTAAKRHTKNFSKSAQIFDEKLKILESFLELCNKRNIKLIFITTPAYYTYRENLDLEPLNKMLETINAFVKEHSNCYYFNWIEDMDFVAEDFYDADHLNEIGAEKLTKKLVRDIDSLGIMK